MEIEKINASQDIKISDYMSGKIEQEMNATLISQGFKRMLGIFMGSAESNIKAYDEAISIAKDILSAVEKEEH